METRSQIAVEVECLLVEIGILAVDMHDVSGKFIEHPQVINADAD